MSAAAPADAAPAADAPPPRRGLGARGPRWAGVTLALLVLLTAGLLAGARFGAETPAGRALIVRLVDGVRVGPVGRLRVEGLGGDVFGRLTLRRLAIVDARGPWLEARDIALDWRPAELLHRRVHARDLKVGELLVRRRPQMEVRPSRPPSEAPVSVAVNGFAGRVRTLPALSAVPGDWNVQGAIDYSRANRATGRLRANSRLHAGDGLRLAFAFGNDRLHLDGDAVEGRGGALAGALGLPADQRFLVRAQADGDDRGGVFHLNARSGAGQPARAEGRWTPKGGRLDAQLQLGASRLTHYFAARVGPQVRLTLTGARRADGLFAIEASAVGAAARAHATGPIDVRRRSTPGLQLQVAVDRLGAWVDDWNIGPTRAQGVLSGALGAFTYRGRLEGERLVREGYTLALASGPAELSRDRKGWRWTGRLQGEGGGGTGLLPPLVGPRPTLDTAGQVLPDNRFLINSLHLQGADLQVDATGGKGLFGDLSFKGGAVVERLAVVRPGAHGGLRAAWSAREGRGEHAWGFSVDARGQAFATGLPEADRLVGAAPHLTARGVFHDSVFDIARADLTGAAAQVTAHGRYGRGDAMAFAGDWRAQGPFAVGPLVVAGVAKGSGVVGGRLVAPTVDLQADLATLDLGKLVVAPAHMTLAFAKTGEALTGQVMLAGASNGGPAQARARFRFVPKGLDLDDVLAEAGGVRVSGGLALRDGQPSTADLQLAAGPGLFLQSGRLTGAVRIAAPGAGAATADLRLQGADVSLPGASVRLKTLQLAAAGPLDRLPLRLSAEAVQPLPISFAGSGLLARTGQARELTLTGGGKVRGQPFQTLAPLRLGFSPEGRTATLRIAAAGGRIALDARQVANGTLHAQGQAAGVSLASLFDDYAGTVDATLRLDGQGARLGGVMDARLTDARTADAPAALALTSTLHATLADSRLRVEAAATNRQGLRAQASIDLPAEAAADPFRIAVVRTRPLHGSYSAEGELKPLWDLLAGGERTLSGRLVARGELAGTLNDPRPTGGVAISGGRFADASTGLVLEKLEAQAQLSADHVTVQRFSGGDGHAGSLSGQGVVSLTPSGASSFQIALTRFQLIDNELGRATASGPVTVVRDAQGRARVVGKLLIDRADITTKTPVPTGVVPMDVVEVNLPTAATEAETTPLPRPGSGLIALDVNLHAPGGVFVRGKGVDAELSLDAHVGGSTARPQLSGTARIVRGFYDFSGKRFDLDQSGVIHLASKPEDIRLDLKAERNDPALDAVVRIRGTASRPEITLTSLPVLPQDEILSRVLFGVSASQLSGFEAAQLASALAGLATGGGFDVLANLRQFAGLDRLAIGGDAAGATVSGGKYITNDIYVELTGAAQGRSQTATTAAQQARTGPSAEVEWRVRKNLSLVSQVWTGGDARLSVRFRRSY